VSQEKNFPIKKFEFLDRVQILYSGAEDGLAMCILRNFLLVRTSNFVV
jgi:hypothetical protein